MVHISVARLRGFAMVSRPLVAVSRNAPSFCHIAVIFLSFPAGSTGKESTCNEGDLGSIPGLGRSPRDGKGYPLQYSGLENFMDCIVHGVAKSQTQLSDFHFVTFLGMLKNLLTPKRHSCIEQTFGLCGRRRGWDVSREQHRNMYII